MPVINMFGKRTAEEVRRSFLRETGLVMEILYEGKPAGGNISLSVIRKKSARLKARRFIGSDSNDVFLLNTSMTVEDLKLIFNHKYYLDTVFYRADGAVLSDDAEVRSLMPDHLKEQDSARMKKSVIAAAQNECSHKNLFQGASARYTEKSTEVLSEEIDEASFIIQYYLDDADPESRCSGNTLVFEQFVCRDMFADELNKANASILLDDLTGINEVFIKDIERFGSAEFVFQKTVRKFRVG